MVRTRFCVTYKPNLRRLSVWRKVTCKCKHWIIFNTLLKVVHSSQFPLVNPGNTTRKKTLVCQKVEGEGYALPSALKYDIQELHFGTFHLGVTIAILLWREKVKYRLLSNHLFQKAQEHVGWRDLRVKLL